MKNCNVKSYFWGIILLKRRKPVRQWITYRRVQVKLVVIKIKTSTWSSLRPCKWHRNDTEHVCLQSWIIQSLCQPRKTVFSVVAMAPMDLCTYNSWVALVLPRLGSLSHREDYYITMKTRVASKLLLLLLLLVLMLLLLPQLCIHSLCIFVIAPSTVCQWIDSKFRLSQLVFSGFPFDEVGENAIVSEQSKTMFPWSSV